MKISNYKEMKLTNKNPNIKQIIKKYKKTNYLLNLYLIEKVI
jgi:hypothetical protein